MAVHTKNYDYNDNSTVRPQLAQVKLIIQLNKAWKHYLIRVQVGLLVRLLIVMIT